MAKSSVDAELATALKDLGVKLNRVEELLCEWMQAYSPLKIDNLCINCEYCESVAAVKMCNALTDPVTGRQGSRECSIVRSTPHLCGRAGRWFCGKVGQ